MVAYCAALGVPRGQLGYAANSAKRLVHELLAAVGRLSDEMAADIPGPMRIIPAGGRS